MLTKIVTETLQGIILIHIDIGILTAAEQINLLAVAEISVVFPDKFIFPAADQVFDIPVQCFVRVTLCQMLVQFLDPQHYTFI